MIESKLTSVDQVLQAKVEKNRRSAEWSRLLRDLIITMGAVYLIFGVVFGICIIQGHSMEPNLKAGDVAVFWRLGKNYQAGDVILFGNAITKDYIKRVIAVEGDVVNIDEQGRLLVNGKEAAEPFVYHKTCLREDGISFPLKVPKEMIFILGDNRLVSKDSREFGAVSKKNIMGRVIFVSRTKKEI